MKLIQKITFALQTCFLVQGHVAFRIIYSGKFGSTLLCTVKRWVFFFINYCSGEIGLLEQILFLILILRIFPS
jgi:hypothetical protein